MYLHVYVLSCSVMSDSATLEAVVCEATLSMEFSRQEFWNGLLFPSPGTLSNPVIKLVSLVSPALFGRWILYPCDVSAAAAKSLQSCPTLCNPKDSSPPGSPVPGILQARTLEWVAISFSSAWKWKVKVKLLSHVWLLVTPWTVACQAPLCIGVLEWVSMPS